MTVTDLLTEFKMFSVFSAKEFDNSIRHERITNESGIYRFGENGIQYGGTALGKGASGSRL